MHTRAVEPGVARPASPVGGAPRGLAAVLLARWWLVAAGVVGALGLAYLYHRTTPPLYEATAQVLVTKKRPDAVTGVDTSAPPSEDYVATQQSLLHSPFLVEQAVRKHGLASLESLAGAKDATEAILAALAVTRNKAPEGRTDNVLNLYYHGANAGDCAKVLAALIDRFKAHLEESYRTNTSESLRLIAQARADLNKDLLEKEAAYRKFRKEAPLLLLKGKDEATLRQDQLSAIDGKRATLAIRQAELRGQLTVLESAARDGTNHEALVAVVMGWTAQADAARGIPQTTVQDRLLPLLAEEQKLLETRGEKHPEVELLRKRIEATRRLLAAPASAWKGTLEQAKTDGNEDVNDPVEVYRLFCKQELRHLEIADQHLGDLYQKEHTRARALTAYEVEDEGYRAAIGRQQSLYDSVVKQLQQFDLAKGLGGYEAQVIASPGLGKKIRPNALVVFPGALFLGLMAGLGLALLAEVRDQRLHSADEVRTLLGLPVLAHIPHYQPAKRRGLAAAARVGTPEVEAYRRVRAALCFGLPGAGCRLIQVVSPVGGSGSTLLAANVAVTIAQSGRRVLLIDANSHRPRLHEFFGLPLEPGLTSIVPGNPAGIRQSTNVQNLWVLPAGSPTAAVADLLAAPMFRELLANLREQFDFVIVDTPALLEVADACTVAAHMDAVLLNLRVGRKSRPVAQRAVALLTALGVRVAGVVINDVSRRRRGGYAVDAA